MAAGDDESKRERGYDDVANPFIAFRRFADEQMSNLMRGIFGSFTPSCPSSSSPDRAFRDYQAWLEDARASRQSLQSEAQEARQIMDIFTRATKDSAQEEVQQAIDDVDGSLRCPYRPADQEPPQCRNQDSEPSLPRLETQWPPPMLSTPMFYNELSSVPVAYLLYSPYSPVHLEHHQGLRNRGVHWREAFEDLLAVQNGEHMSSEREQDASVNGVDWVRRVIDLMTSKRDLDSHSSSPAQAPRRDFNLSSRFRTGGHSDRDASSRSAPQNYEDNAENTNDDEHLTEFDLYEHFLGSQGTSSNEEPSSQAQPQSQSRSFAHLQHNSTVNNELGSKPSILSTLTTTERKTLPDGTITTKVVLKKRFSDGREESTETMHTQNPTSRLEHQPPTKGANNEQPSDPDSKAKKSNGWFWS